jgi:hypothetical protein
MDIEKEMFIEINKLYPTESLTSIRPELIKQFMDVILPDGSNTDIFIIDYMGNYYIVEGHHQLLAASYLGAKRVRAYLVDYHCLSFLSNSQNIESTLSSVGMTTLFDFEGIGGYKYDDYPKYYSNGGIT